MRSKQSWAIRIVVLDWGDIQKIFWYLLTSKCNTNIVNWWGGESRGKLKMDIGGACPVSKHSKTDKNRVQTTWSWKSKGGRNLPGDGSSGEKHSGWSFSGGSICPCSHQVKCFIISSDLFQHVFDFVKTISSQAGQCAQVFWRPLALRRLDQPRRSGSWSCALPCLHHPGWVAPRGSPEGEKVVVFLLQPWSSLKSEPAQWNTPGLPLPCQSADGDKECCCSIVVAKNDPDPFVQMEEVEVVAAYRDRLLALPCVRDTSYPR